MSAAHLLEELTREGFVLTAAGTDLDVDAPAGRITSAVLARLRLHKAELLHLLSAGVDADTISVTLDMRDAIEERAAVFEFDAGLARQLAELRAVQRVQCRTCRNFESDPMNPRQGVGACSVGAWPQAKEALQYFVAECYCNCWAPRSLQ